ncbi:MAG TPA: adenine phosphoribosyltransferase [Mycobacteriales bacterium]|nr:adenine phosphoribosyltransferase [Mycobacteriales bacterium]
MVDGADGDVAGLVAARIRDVPDFPRPGVTFKDITPLLADGPVFAAVADEVVRAHALSGFDLVAGVEARGFLLAAAVAYAARVGVLPVRKAGKLPGPVLGASYTLEYGEATIEMPVTGWATGRRVLVVDDVLATGGTLAATADLVRRAGGTVAGLSVIIELSLLGGRSRLGADGAGLHAVLTV